MRTYLILFIFLVTSMTVLAGAGSWSQRLKLRDVLLGPDYTMSSPYITEEGAHSYLNRIGLIHLDYTRKDQSDLEDWNAWKIWVTVEYKAAGSSTYTQKTLEITSETGFYKYSDYIKFGLGVSTGYDIHVSDISGEYDDGTNNWVSVSAPQYDPHFPVDIDLRLELREEKWYDLDITSMLEDVSDLNFDGADFRAHWSYIEGAEQYDFEWVWIDEQSQEYSDLATPPSGVTAEEWPFLLKKSSRVRISHTHHVLDNTYAGGKLFFRVRGISKFLESSNGGVIDQVKEGDWSYFDAQDNIVSHTIQSTDIFEQEKNWLYGIAYAEEGKSVSSVTFYDGSNRGRQSLTYNTSDDITLVGESKFDFEGRQTISVVPAPVKGRSLGYRTKFNLVASSSNLPLTGTDVFDEDDFDFGTYNLTSAEQLAAVDGSDGNRELGASQYFSNENKFDDDLFRSAIPDANGYVYSQTVYRNDGTGRIEEVGGIGETFRVGGGHSVKTYYGSPSLAELKRLFGSNVPDTLNGYRKEMVQDANGQHSVTYYDKRGNVIATGLSGESPLSLLPLDGQNSETIVTPIGNNIDVDDYTMIAEHTHMNGVENDTLKLFYDVSGVVNDISSMPVQVGDLTIDFGDFCSTCQYDLTIEVLDQNGNQVPTVGNTYGDNLVAPFFQNIDPSSPCYDPLTGLNVNTPASSGAGVSSGQISLEYIMPEIGEYRIIKTLSVDQASMQAAFDAQLEASGMNDPSSFVADYLSNIDISGCFNNCDDYCYWYAKHKWLNDFPSIPWNSADETELDGYLTQDQLAEIAACKSGVCDVNEMYENTDPSTMDSEPYISPMSQACDGFRQQMLDQISPGGVFYDNHQSTFWQDVHDAYFSTPGDTVTIGTTTYWSIVDMWNPSNFTEDLAVFLLPQHREYCHLQSCGEWAKTMDYSNTLTIKMNEMSWNNPTNFFTDPFDPYDANNASATTLITPLVDYSVGEVGYGPGDPFQYQAWDTDATSSSLLEDAVNDYYLYIDYGNLPSNEQFDAITNPPSGFTPFSTTNRSLRAYVDHAVEHIKQNYYDPVANYEEQRRFMFNGLYGQIKMELIKEYKLALMCAPNNDPCPCFYYSDDNAVFIGPMSSEEMEQLTAGALSGITNGQSCEEVAYNSTVSWLNALPQNCLDDLGIDLSSLSTSTPEFDPVSLYSGSQAQLNLSDPTTTSTYLPQLMYDYVMETCPNNLAGWFFNPDENDTGTPQTPDTFGEDEYIAIYDILNGTCGITQVGFETVPAPSSVTLNTTTQYIESCILNFIGMINDGLQQVNDYHAQGNPIPICGSGNYGDNLSVLIDVNSITYPGLNSPAPCDLNGGYQFGLCQDANGELQNLFGIDNDLGGCDFKLYTIYDQLVSNPFGDAAMLSLSNPIKFTSLPQYGLNYNVVSFDVLYADGDIASAGTIGSVFFISDEVPCLDWGDFTDQTITLGGFLDSLPDYESDCVDATLGQATVDAMNIYNDALNDLQNQFLEKMSTCISSVNENFSMEYELKEYQYTLYYYDLAGNLVQTVPPQGVHIVAPSYDANGTWNAADPVHRMETRYKYNGLNTLVAQYTPDGGHSDFVLDKLYRVRYSQNARQKNDDKASYTKYDELGRVEEAGEMYLGSSNNNVPYLKSKAEDNNFPTSTMRQDYTYTYYEEGYLSDPSIVSMFTTGDQQNLRNTIGAIEHIQADYIEDGTTSTTLTGSEIRTVISYSYDAHKNVKEMVSTNYHLESIGQQHKTVRYEYDLISGNVNELIYQQDQVIQLDEANGIEERYSDEFRHKYYYDANNRLVRVFTSKDGGTTWDKEAKYFYYLHGALARTELGEDEVQGIDYAYNLQGWLKGVNASSLDATRDLGHDADVSGDNQYFGVDAFGFMLSYFDADYQSIVPTTAFSNIGGVTSQNLHVISGGNEPRNLYNGNIHNMTTALRDYTETPLTVLSNNYQYDQLQRIRSMKVYDSPNDLAVNNSFNDAQLHRNGAYQTSYTFDKNGNLKALSRNGNGEETQLGSGVYTNHQMDNFTYYYYDGLGGPNTNDPNELNRLASVVDNISSDIYDVDIEDSQDQFVSNYEYDESGQLEKDFDEEIEEIIWTVTGKVKEIKFTTTSGKSDLKFVYDPMDMRVMKIQYNNADKTDIKYTYYSYDAQGNALATYSRTIAAPSSQQGNEIYEDLFYLEENMVYGSSRLGIDNRGLLLTTATIDQSIAGNTNIELAENFVWTIESNDFYSQSQRIVGRKYYELSNHLGNVLEVISDRKTWIDNNDTKVYSADVISYSDYYPYGMLLPGRNDSETSSSYRYSFQGQETDDEIKGKGNSVNYKYRMHDPRIGRFFAVDPLAAKYPHNSPYAFSENMVMHMIELEGLESAPSRIYHNTGAESGAKILLDGAKNGTSGIKAGESGWAYFMTNPSGRGAGSTVAGQPVQLAGEMDLSSSKNISSSEWSGFYQDAKVQMGIGNVSNTNMTGDQVKTANAIRNQIVAKHMTAEGGDLWTIKTKGGQSIVAAKGNALNKFKVTDISKGWDKLVKTANWRGFMMKSPLRTSMLKKGITALAIFDVALSLIDMKEHGNIAPWLVPNVDWDEPWHKQIQTGLIENNFDKAYTGLKMLRNNDRDYSVYWMTHGDMLNFARGEITGLHGGTYPSNTHFGNYPYMMVKYKGSPIGIMDVPEKSKYAH